MRNLLRISALLVVVATTCGAPAKTQSIRRVDIIKENKQSSTHELLSSLGLKKLNVPASFYKKRVAEQGRRHATGDSRMFVIKLPPNTSYYTHADPAPAAARTLPLQMTGNGKPARVYHWNLPVLQQIAKGRPQARFDNDVVDVEITPTWLKGSRDHPNGLEYYVPVPEKKTSIRKYFSGNGKLKSFYVLQRNNKTVSSLKKTKIN